MIDIHSHILYDIPGDDGSQSEAMTWEMIDQALQAGIRHIICTPHVNKRGQVPDWGLIQERIADLNQFLEEKGLPLQLHSGGEIRLDESVGNLLEGANRVDSALVSKIAESFGAINKVESVATKESMDADSPCIINNSFKSARDIKETQ